MSFNHEKIQEELVDVYYGEKPMRDEIKNHIDGCSECAAYWNKLQLIKKELPASDTDIEIDERVIDRAFREADVLMERRKNMRDLVVFAVIASLLAGIVGWLIYMGYAKSIIQVQIILMFCVPLSVPFLIRQRLMKEEL